jgi:predicted  nucleic acid-binding Zn-ribbon protein
MSELRDKLNQLFKLQMIDNEILENMRHLKRLEAEDSQTHKQYLDLKDLHEKLHKEIQPIVDRAEEIKAENMKHTEKKKDCEDRLFNGDTDPRDLQYLQKEREQYINLIKKNEDELVRLMVKVDSVNIKKMEIEEKLSELEPQYKQEMGARDATRQELNQRVEELKQERKAFNEFKDKSLLALYQKLQRENDGVALATLNDGVCEGCFVEVSKSTLMRIEEDEGIVRCPHCSRILIVPERAHIES